MAMGNVMMQSIGSAKYVSEYMSISEVQVYITVLYSSGVAPGQKGKATLYVDNSSYCYTFNEKNKFQALMPN